jgi:peptide/nickel transport system permease protein
LQVVTVWRRLGLPAKVGIGIIVAVVLTVVLGSLLTPYSPYAVTGIPNSPPSLAHPFGTDSFGKDVFSQVSWGSYPSLFVALVAALASSILGFFAGSISGYYKKLEGVLGGTGDVFMALPAVPAMLMLGADFKPTDTLIALLLTLFFWALCSRAVRAQVQSVKNLPYVEAARLQGLKDHSILVRIIMPEVASIAIAYFIIYVGLGVVVVTALEYLGVGNLLVVSWGSILYWAGSYAFYLGDWWWIVFPGVIITFVAMGFALIGFQLEELFNPRLRK